MNAREVKEKLKEYAVIIDSLKEAGIVRTYNSPVGDYAEWLVSEKLNLKLEKNSKKGYDAVDESSGIRYQVKSRWMHPGKNSRQLNVIRKYDENQFEYLIVVIFGNNFEVEEAYQIPHDAIKDFFEPKEYQNGVIITLTKEIISDSRVEDVTELLK